MKSNEDILEAIDHRINSLTKILKILEKDNKVAFDTTETGARLDEMIELRRFINEK